MQNYFLDHNEYDYLCILPDDLIVSGESVKIIFNDVLLNQKVAKVLSGHCNLSMLDGRPNICLMPHVLDIDRSKRGNYVFPNSVEQARAGTNGKNLVRAGFAGFALMMIHRDVLCTIRIETDARANNLDYGCCVDLVLCYWCHVQSIPVYVDLRASMIHKKISDKEVHFSFAVGKKPAETIFEAGCCNSSADSRDMTSIEMCQATSMPS